MHIVWSFSQSKRSRECRPLILWPHKDYQQLAALGGLPRLGMWQRWESWEFKSHMWVTDWFTVGLLFWRLRVTWRSGDESHKLLCRCKSMETCDLVPQFIKYHYFKDNLRWSCNKGPWLPTKGIIVLWVWKRAYSWLLEAWCSQVQRQRRPKFPRDCIGFPWIPHLYHQCIHRPGDEM